MSTPEERLQYWQREARIAAGIWLHRHSTPTKGTICSGSIDTLPIHIVVEESSDTLGRLNCRVVGECPKCGRVFNYNPPKEEWIIPKTKPPR